MEFMMNTFRGRVSNDLDKLVHWIDSTFTTLVTSFLLLPKLMTRYFLLRSPMSCGRGIFFSLYKNDPKTMSDVLYRAIKYINTEVALLARKEKPKKKERQEDARQNKGRKTTRTGD